VTRSTRRNS